MTNLEAPLVLTPSSSLVDLAAALKNNDVDTDLLSDLEAATTSSITYPTSQSELWSMSFQNSPVDAFDPFLTDEASGYAMEPVKSETRVSQDNPKKKRGRKPSGKAKESTKKKRPPPTPHKAKLRTYERRSRHKRQCTMQQMKEEVKELERRVAMLCSADDSNEHRQLTKEIVELQENNFHLRQTIDEHKFFQSMVHLEFEHRESAPEEEIEATLTTPFVWHPMSDDACYDTMRKSLGEIESFSNDPDFTSSGLQVFGWSEKRLLRGHDVRFLFHKQFHRYSYEDLAHKSFEMRAVQDQCSRYLGPFLRVQVEIIQRLSDDVVVVRRRIRHEQDGWVHHTIYLLFRMETEDGHVVCIRDLNPRSAEQFNVVQDSTKCVIWAHCFIWWRFKKMEEGGFQVEYGGSLGSATKADAAFWMKEVLLCALRWESLTIGPLLKVS